MAARTPSSCSLRTEQIHPFVVTLLSTVENSDRNRRFAADPHSVVRRNGAMVCDLARPPFCPPASSEPATERPRDNAAPDETRAFRTLAVLGPIRRQRSAGVASEGLTLPDLEVLCTICSRRLQAQSEILGPSPPETACRALPSRLEAATGIGIDAGRSAGTMGACKEPWPPGEWDPLD